MAKQKRNTEKARAWQDAYNALRRGDPEPMEQYDSSVWDTPPRGLIPSREWAARIGGASVTIVHRWFAQGRLPGAIMLPKHGEMGQRIIYVPKNLPRPPKLKPGRK